MLPNDYFVKKYYEPFLVKCKVLIFYFSYLEVLKLIYNTLKTYKSSPNTPISNRQLVLRSIFTFKQVTQFFFLSNFEIIYIQSYTKQIFVYLKSIAHSVLYMFINAHCFSVNWLLNIESFLNPV